MIIVQKPGLVDDWRRCWRWLSMQCMTIAIGIQSVWAMLDSDQRATLPHYFVTAITVGVLFLGMAGRLLKQETPPARDNSEREV